MILSLNTPTTAFFTKDDGVIRMVTEGQYACGNERLAAQLLTKALSAQGHEFHFEALGADAKNLLALAKSIAAELGKEIV